MSLVVSKLKVRIDSKSILQGVDLTVASGQVVAIMGPNGSGKSTLANTLAGHPSYQVESGEVMLDGGSLLDKSPDERANAGLFLAFQYPVEVPGVRIQNFLKLAYDQRFKDIPAKQFKSVLAFREHLQQLAEELGVRQELLSRGLNEGFSGGEKKRLEILQMALLEPKYAVLDETDSGLDIDALKAVALGVKQIVAKHRTGVIVITHYQRLLEYLAPDVVHVMKSGVVVQTGGPELVKSLEQTGYTTAK